MLGLTVKRRAMDGTELPLHNPVVAVSEFSLPEVTKNLR